MTKHVLISFLILLAAPACKDNPKYCEGNPGNNCDNMWDASVECTTSAQCSGATPACDTTSMTCVQCTVTEASACTGATPVCGNEKSCRGCAAHSECSASNACNVETGACIGEADVAYVAAGGTGNCDKATPCGTMAAGLAKNRAFVKVTGALNETTTTTINRAVTIIAAPGASINTTQDDVPVLSIATSNADVVIHDLEVTGGTMSGGVGIALPTGGTPKLRLVRATIAGNQGGGISSTAGTLVVTRSTVSGNPGGGISVSGVGTSFRIDNNFITYNGVATGPNATQVGGAAVLPNTAGSKFEWNTVAFNSNDGSVYRAGVTCVGAMVVATGNVVYANTEGTTTSDSTQRTGSCQYGNTLALGTSANHLGFKSPLTSPFDFHLTATSPTTIVGAGGACVGVDFDGDIRPIGGACDLGADEFKP